MTGVLRMKRCLIALVAAAGTLASIARAQPVDPFTVTGRAFAGVRFPLEATPGVIDLRGVRAWAWKEEGGGSGTRRLLLEKDVRLTLGTFEFHASKASVWLEELEPGVYQVYAVMDRVSTPRADPSVAVSAERLAVQGVVRTGGSPTLRADLVQEGRPSDPFLGAAERELAVHLRRLLGIPTLEAGEPIARGADASVSEDELEEMLARLPAMDRERAIFDSTGTISFASGDVVAVSGEEETTLLLTGGVTVLYQGRTATDRLPRTMQMKAERAVVFLPPDALDVQSISGLDASSVRGIYLEGEVMATDGQYTVRGPSVFYDLQNDRALVLDAVFWAYDRAKSMPLYVRAKAVRQESADEFKAEKVTIANTGFAKPNFTLGARKITLTRRHDARGEADYTLDARGVTARGMGVPFFYFPWYRGDPVNRPLRNLTFDSSGGGPAIKTTWDGLAMLGIEGPSGLDVDLLADFHFERGPGVGVELRWDRPGSEGNLLTYWLVNDQGEDRLRTGRELGHDNEVRGLTMGEYRQRLDANWKFWLDAAYASDETFVDAMFDPLQSTRRPLSTGLYVARADDNSHLAIEARGNLNDFLVNDYQLQTRGYMTEKLPEVLYTRQADDILGGVSPGTLTWFSEYRAGRMEMSFNEPTAREMGYVNDNLAQRAFGINADESIGDRLRAAGFTEDAVTRLDTRHELVLKLNMGALQVTPSVVGRVTHWDDDFEEFSPDEDDSTRFWGGAGVRVGTTIQRVRDGVESRALDLHRLRHIIEPSVTVWRGTGTIDRADLPIYDQDVESLLDGTIYRIAIDQTWQTQRGGAGRWRSVDVFTLNAEFVTSSGTDGEAAIGRYFDFRPELTLPGDWAGAEATWRLSDALAATGSVIYDTDAGRSERSSVGLLVDHSPLMSTSFEYRTIDPIDAKYLDVVSRYLLGDKYAVYGLVSYDIDQSGFRTVGAEVRREFQSVVVGVSVSYDDIEGRTSFGFVVSPKGFGRGVRARGIGASEVGVDAGG